MRLRYAVEDEPLGTAGAIRFAADGIDERFIVCNGDVLTGLDLSAMVEFHDERGAEVTIALTRVEDPSAFGVVPTAADGGVIAFVEKPAPGSAPSDWINAGTYVLEPSFLVSHPAPAQRVGRARDVPAAARSSPGRLFGFRTDAYWLDIGTPEKYLQAHLDVLRGASAVRRHPGARELVRGHLDAGRRHDRSRRDGARAHAARPAGTGAVGRAGARLGARCRARSWSRARCSTAPCCTPSARVSHDSTVEHSVIGRDSVVRPDVTLTGHTLIGAGVTVPSGTRMSSGRMPRRERRG